MTTEETTQQQPPAAGEKPGDGLRDVPTDIGEYTKFVKEGGLEHNAKVLGREAAEKAAKEAGIIPADKTAGEQQQETHRKNGFQQRITRLQRKIGERDQVIKDLQSRVAAGSAPAPASNGAQPAAAAGTSAAAAAKTAPPANGKAPADDGKKTPPKPLEANFKTYGEFIEALTDWQTDRKLEAREAKRAEEQRAQTDAQKGKEITDAHTARVNEAKERYPDWDAAFKGLTNDDFSDPILVFVFESDVGPDVTYHLVTHRDELARIRKLSPVRQAAELGKIEDKILAARPAAAAAGEGDKGDKKPDEEEEDETPPKKAAKAAATSKAPPPEKPIGGRAAAEDTMPDPSDFVAYEAWSKRQAAKKKGK